MRTAKEVNPRCAYRIGAASCQEATGGVISPQEYCKRILDVLRGKEKETCATQEPTPGMQIDLPNRRRRTGEHLLLKHCCLWWLTIAMLSSTIPVGIGGDAEEARLVKTDREGEGVLGVDGGEMYADCGFWWWWIDRKSVV